MSVNVNQVTVSPARVIVDPNSFARGNPSLSVAAFEDFDRIPEIGDIIWAVQPDDDGFEGLAPGYLRELHPDQGIALVEVVWSSFILQRDPHAGFLRQTCTQSHGLHEPIQLHGPAQDPDGAFPIGARSTAVSAEIEEILT